jgi:tetratricopeptide (TPR) repeat protein
VAETELAVGRLRHQQRDDEDAARHYQLALDQFHDIQDRRGEADAQLALGEARHLQRQSEEAVRLWSEALTTYRATRDRLGEAQTLGCLGEECLLQRDYAGALTDFELALNLWREIGDPLGAAETMYARVGQSLALLDRRGEALRAFDLAAAARSLRQFGWLGWRAVTNGEFEDALVHFTAMTNRDPAASWQVGLALAQLACGDRIGAERQMEAGLSQANPQELGEACRWIEYVARIAPSLNLKAEQFGLMC